MDVTCKRCNTSFPVSVWSLSVESHFVIHNSGKYTWLYDCDMYRNMKEYVLMRIKRSFGNSSHHHHGNHNLKMVITSMQTREWLGTLESKVWMFVLLLHIFTYYCIFAYPSIPLRSSLISSQKATQAHLISIGSCRPLISTFIVKKSFDLQYQTLSGLMGLGQTYRDWLLHLMITDTKYIS